jgi:hypothetical protein
MLLLKWLIVSEDTGAKIIFIKRVLGEWMQFHPLYEGGNGTPGIDKAYIW